MHKLSGRMNFFYLKHMDNSSFEKHLPVGSRTYDWGIYCSDIGRSSVRPESGEGQGSSAGSPPTRRADPPSHRAGENYRVVYVTRGKGNLLCSPDFSLPIGGGDVLLLSPHAGFRYAADPDAGWDAYWIDFNGSYVEVLERRRFFSSPQPVHKVGYHASLLEDFFAAFEEANQQLPGFQFRLGATVLRIIAEILATRQTRLQQSDDDAIVERARLLMRERVNGNLELSEILDELSISYSGLLRLFKKQFGLSPLQYFLNLKISTAKTLLRRPGARVKEVAFSVGIDNPYYFSRLFLKKTGFRPTEWIRNTRLQESQEAAVRGER